MARGSSNNVAENRTRSKRGTPTKEIEEKQTSDSIEKKSLVTRRKNTTASTSKLAKKRNKKSDKLETDNSSATSSVSNKKEELNLANEPVGKKEVLKRNQQNKASKTVGRKRKSENTVDELAEETVSDVESEIVGKKTVKRPNKKLNSDTMDENSQDSNKSDKSDFTKTENAKKVEDYIIEEHNNEDKNLEINIKAKVEMSNINNNQEKDISTTLDDSSQGSIKSGTTRKTRSSRKVEENITVEQNETKNEIQNEFEAKADIVSDTSQDTIKPIKGSLARKTRSTKKIDEDIIVEQQETIAVEAYKDMNSDESSARVDIVDENSQDSVKMRKAISTRKTRSTKTAEESVVEHTDTEKIKLDYLDMKDKTDTVDNDNVSTPPIKSSTRRTRNTKNVDESVVELEDIKAKEIKEKVDTGPDSILKNNKGGSTRKTRSARKAEVNIDVELKDSQAEELETNIKVDVLDDSSVDSIASNQSGPTRRTRKAKKVIENIAQTSIVQLEGEKGNAKVDVSDEDSLDSMNSNQSGTLRKTRNAKKVKEISIEKQNVTIEKTDRNEEKVELCTTDSNSKDSLDANKDIVAKDNKVKIFIEKNLSKDTDKVLEQITCNEVEERIEKDEKEIESDYADDISKELFLKTKNLEDLEQNECIDMNSDDKASNSGKFVDDTKNFDHMNNEKSKLQERMDQCKNNAGNEIANTKNEVGEERKEIEQRNIDEETHEREAEYYNPTSNVTSLCLKDKDSKVNVFDSQESEVLQTCVDDNLAGDKINVEKENDGNSIVGQIKKNELEVIDTTENFYKNKEDSGKDKMEESDDNESSEIEKDISLCGMEETLLLENVKEKVLNTETFDEDKQRALEDDQSSKVVRSEKQKEQATFEDVSTQEEKCKEAGNIINTVEIVAGNKTDCKSPEELKLKDSKICQRETGEVSINNFTTNISENLDHEDSTTSIIGEIESSEKASVDIDVCSDKTEEASVINFELESSTTDSDTGNLVIADSVENTNTETDISKLVARTAHAVSGSSDIDDMNQEGISNRITDTEKTEMNVTGELSAANITETSLNNITGNQQELEVETVKGAGVELSEFPTQITTLNETENPPNKDTYVKSSSQTLAETDKLEELNSSQILSENCKENVLTQSSMNISVTNKETVDSEPKIAPQVKSTVNQVSEDNIQTPLINAAGTSNDKSFAESCSSSDKIVVDSSHNKSKSGEKQKTSKMKKSSKSVKKSSLDNKEMGKNEACKKIVTTYEVSSNVDSKRGDKRSLAEGGEGSSSTEVSLALKIKRKRVEGVESYDVSPSSLGEHAIPNISDETNIKEQTQKLFADYQSVPGPSGMQQESRRSTRKRKREESDREKSAAPIRMYLEKFVPFLLEGLLKITYVRPEDPIQYLAEWMKENKEAAYSSMNFKDNGDISSDE